MPKLIQVIESTITRGNGKDNPYRTLRAYYTTEGDLLGIEPDAYEIEERGLMDKKAVAFELLNEVASRTESKWPGDVETQAELIAQKLRKQSFAQTKEVMDATLQGCVVEELCGATGNGLRCCLTLGHRKDHVWASYGSPISSVQTTADPNP